MKIATTKEISTVEDADGNVTTTTLEKISKIAKLEESDYIKIYTNMWCDFNRIPIVWRQLFLLLATNMTYADASTLNDPHQQGGQIVNTGIPYKTNYCNKLGWGDSMYNKGIRALCDCGAIRRVARGVYQINPSYAGRGLWKYNPKLNQGGIEDIQAFFDFKEKTIDTKIVWANDHTSAADLKGVGIAAADNKTTMTIKTTSIAATPPTTPQKAAAAAPIDIEADEAEPDYPDPNQQYLFN